MRKMREMGMRGSVCNSKNTRNGGNGVLVVCMWAVEVMQRGEFFHGGIRDPWRGEV